MSFYQTGNPVPSIDPRDLDDNAKHIDEIANSTLPTFVDRLGVTRKTLSGIIDDNNSLATNLENSSDPLKGIGLVGRASVSLASAVDLLTAKQDVSALYNTSAYYPGVFATATPSEALGANQFKWSPLIPKTAHDGGSIISPTVPWDGLQSTLASFLAGTGETQPAGFGCFVAIESRKIYSERWGAKWDGATDDTAAINAAADYAAVLNTNSGPLLANRIGATLVLPSGKTLISTPIHIKQAGIRLIGNGQYATLIECIPGFVGEAAILFEHSTVESVFTSSSVEEFSVDTKGVACHGILYNHLYDHTGAINIKVSGTAVDKQAYYVRPRVGKTDPISQSLYMRGCTFYKVAAGTTPTVILQTLQEFNLVQVKIWNSHNSVVQGSSYPLELQGCRSGILSQCSFLCTTAHGVNIIDNGRQTTAITIDTPLFENVTGGPVRAVSSNVATFPIANLQVRNPRYELPTGGEYFLNGCVRGYIESGARNVNIPAASVQNHIILDGLDKLVVSNSANTYEVLPQVTSGDHTFGVRMKIETSISPRLSLKNRASADEYRMGWVYDGVTDNGYQITKLSGGISYPLYTQSADMLHHYFYDFIARELLHLRAGAVAGECSMFTLYYDGSTHTTRRVKAGAINTGPGGAGRAIYVDN